jgi:catechol 2,3-dioxygenase
MANSPVRPNLSHMGIYVRNLNQMRAFYVDVLGLIESDHGHGTTAPNEYVFLTADPTKHHQLLLASGRPSDAQISTVNQMSFKLPDLDALRTLHDRVKKHGVERLRKVSHGNAWSVYFHDPEGNQVELYVDTPWYVAQPHSDPLDLDLPNDEIVRRTEEACRNSAQFMPVADWQAKMRGHLGD